TVAEAVGDLGGLGDAAPHIDEWRVVIACFTPQYQVRMVATPANQFQEAALPAMHDEQFSPPDPSCQDGWYNLNLTKRPD
ncbi:hypothetical protein, partial [Nocardia seriolae]|uniref:hypothetical protein n=1 Tax=Nocardia seriolae TaxID=37332 RepID=UPI00187C5154